ncbi:spore gernimation protein GerQ [Paenibacillus swuensis]|uniref:Spore gernimation protein GerQ n=2 Tax=Paenibacillus swuensis TaxID=1178515 RepID=A0A172TPH2_9BACL|nr:spore gernimation protein GerQ [Paenibacillus swuensis]
MQQQGQTYSSQNIQPQLNHGGHEMFDLHEVLAGMINVLDQYMIFRTFVKDQELLDILDRQYHFILSEYDTTVESFSTGRKPSRETSTYMMKGSTQVTYGLKPSQPKKPNQSLADVKDAGISGHMLGLIKSSASLLTMTAVEATNPVVRRVLASQVQNYIEMAYEIFLYQNKNAYYQVPQLQQSDMQQMVKGYAEHQGEPSMPSYQNPNQRPNYMN